MDNPQNLMQKTSLPPIQGHKGEQQNESKSGTSYCHSLENDGNWRKTIMVGGSYQAQVPQGLSEYGDDLPYQNEDKLLWDPKSYKDSEIEEFLKKAKEGVASKCITGRGPPESESLIKDDDHALYILLQCGYDFEEALRRHTMNFIPPVKFISLFSEEECKNFECGLRTHGKNFHLIQQKNVRTRSVGELVQYYYLWKKNRFS